MIHFKLQKTNYVPGIGQLWWNNKILCFYLVVMQITKDTILALLYTILCISLLDACFQIRIGKSDCRDTIKLLIDIILLNYLFVFRQKFPNKYGIIGAIYL